MNRKAVIYFDDTKAGELCETDEGFSFSYYDDYLEHNEACAISLTLPLQPEPFISPVIFSFFDGLIPEGWLLDIAHNSWKIDLRDRMGLLLACCKDCIGKVSVVAIDGGDT